MNVRAIFRKDDKELYYVMNSGYSDAVYLEHAMQIFSETMLSYSPVDLVILREAKKRGMFPIEPCDTFTITDGNGTRQYQRENNGWKILSNTDGAIDDPELVALMAE